MKFLFYELSIATQILSWETEGFPGGSDGKESTCNAGDPGSIPGSGRSPGEGNGYPLQCSCLENSTDWGARWVSLESESERCSVMSNSSWPRGLYSPRSSPEYWSGHSLPFPPPGDLPNPGIKPRSPVLQADSLPTELSGKSYLRTKPQSFSLTETRPTHLQHKVVRPATVALGRVSRTCII